MDKMIIATVPEQVAIDFVESEKKEHSMSFSMIPKSIGENVKFWAKLVEINPDYISWVPEAILEKEDFAKLVDHEVFYRYLPKKYLTVEDYKIYKENPEQAISVRRSPVKINEHEEFIWYALSRSSFWYSASKIDAKTVFNHLDEDDPASGIFPELWAQDLADLIWNSSKAIIFFDAIPKKYVRAEWDELMQLLLKKRYPLFGYEYTSAKPELLAEYWRNFPNEHQVRKALKLEALVKRCSNPFGYTVTFWFGESEKGIDPTPYYKELWLVLKPIIENIPELIEEFFELYQENFSRQLPDELFNIEWTRKEDILDLLAHEYRSALKAMQNADCEIERLEAEDLANQSYKEMRDEILSYHDMSEEKIKKLIDSIVEEKD